MKKDEVKQTRLRIIEALQSTQRKGIDDLVLWLDSTNFFTSPASTMFHGNYEGGLALHSYKVYEEFQRQVEHYRLNVPADSVTVAAILHDVCKVNYYITNRLKSGNTSEHKPYKVEDNFPLGHGEKSVVLVQRYIDLTAQEAMLIRWHMGTSDPAWEEYSEKIEKMHPEVTLLHHVDKEVSLLYKL